ncbi:transcription antitermination factor NusB [Gammaproteobacteria bacterium]|nr:transcription antitermination factor NusB [Gammaproteobacteria bacterium]
MSKNLGKHKQELQTRECLVQAIYQYIFHASNLNSLIEQFLKENTPKKINFNYFTQRLENIFEQSDDLKEIMRDLKNNEGEHLEIIDEAILWLGIVEIRANELPHPVVIDECIRLAKKFSNPNSYKFVNAKLDEWLKTNQAAWLKKSN